MIGRVVFAAQVICPLTITLLVGVVWFAATMTWLRRQREKQERAAAAGPPPDGDTSPVRESPNG